MNIVPAKMQQGADSLDRTRALVLGVMSALAAFFAFWKIFWLTVGTAIFSGFGYSGYSGVWLVAALLWWIAIAALGTLWAVAFLGRYVSKP